MKINISKIAVVIFAVLGHVVESTKAGGVTSDKNDVGNDEARRLLVGAAQVQVQEKAQIAAIKEDSLDDAFVETFEKRVLKQSKDGKDDKKKPKKAKAKKAKKAKNAKSDSDSDSDSESGDETLTPTLSPIIPETLTPTLSPIIPAEAEFKVAVNVCTPSECATLGATLANDPDFVAVFQAAAVVGTDIDPSEVKVFLRSQTPCEQCGGFSVRALRSMETRLLQGGGAGQTEIYFGVVIPTTSEDVNDQANLALARNLEYAVAVQALVFKANKVLEEQGFGLITEFQAELEDIIVAEPTAAPVATNTPVATTAPVATNTPVATTAPVATNAPVATTAPVVTTTAPVATTTAPAPVATNTPVATTAPVAPTAPVANLFWGTDRARSLTVLV